MRVGVFIEFYLISCNQRVKTKLESSYFTPLQVAMKEREREREEERRSGEICFVLVFFVLLFRLLRAV